MTKAEMVLKTLKNTYRENEPIFLSDLRVPGLPGHYLRQLVKKLVDSGQLRRFDTGVYFLPKKSIFRSGSTLSVDEVIQKKYLISGGKRCGYVGGLMLANNLGVTTQVPMVYEIYSNKATGDYRETKLGNVRVILRKPTVEVNDQNADALQFLDLLKELPEISELTDSELKSSLLAYMQRKKIGFDQIAQYLPLYPDRIYKNMYEVGLLHGISTQ